MQNAIYISNQQLQLVSVSMQGKRKLKKVVYKSLPITLGSIVNGKIIDSEEILQVLLNAKTLYPKMMKSPILVIDSSLIIIKKTYIPILNRWQINSIIANEFVYNADTMQNLIYDAAVYKEGPLNTLLSCGLEKSLLESYTKLFERAHINLKKIDIALNVMIKYAEDFNLFPEKVFVLNAIDGNNMLSLLFENGVYNFSTRYRLLNSPETPEFIAELDQQLSSLIQFNIAKKSPEPIKASYYTGLYQHHLKALAEKTEGRDIKIAAPNLLNNTELNSYIFPVAAAMTATVKNDINLLKAEKKYNPQGTSQEKKNNQLYKGIIIAFLAMFFGYYGVLQVSNHFINTQIGTLNGFMNTATTQQQYETAQANETALSETIAKTNSIRAATTSINSSKWFSSSLMQAFFAATNNEIRFDNFAFTENIKTFSIDAVAANEQAAANFITRLKKLDFVESISYSGYNKDTTLPQYYFHLDCLLKAGEANV